MSDQPGLGSSDEERDANAYTDPASGAVPDAMWGQGLAVLDQHLAAQAAYPPPVEPALDPPSASALDSATNQLGLRVKASSATAEGSPAGGPGESEAPPAGGQAVEPFCPSVEVWVEQVLAPTYARRATSQFRWCAQWWRHPEAVSRLEALWRAWEALRRDPLLGMASWLRDHLDAQLPVLCGAAGPFAECDPTRHFDPAQPCLPLRPVPPGWWADTPTP